MVRGIRGAISVNENTSEEILSGTKELLSEIKAENGFCIEDIVSVFFSMTPDLNAAFPAAAAREMDWTLVPLFGMQEADIVGGLEKCIRILVQVNCDKNQNEIKHCYLREAVKLRNDLQEKIDVKQKGEIK